jgi:ribosomal protein S18 acetylase RimI-like enzyme
MDVRFGIDPPGLRASDLGAFFNEWPRRPSEDALDAMIRGSYRVVVGRIDDEIVAFANAISDGHMFAYIPYVEVHPDHRSKGIGTELMRTMLGELAHIYGVDLSCDDDLVAFYERVGLQPVVAMISRNDAGL